MKLYMPEKPSSSRSRWGEKKNGYRLILLREREGEKKRDMKVISIMFKSGLWSRMGKKKFPIIPDSC